MSDRFDPNGTQARLEAACKYQAEELENVGKKPCHTCGECKNCITDENGATETGYYCSEKSEYGEEDAIITEYHECSPDDDTDSDEHGDWNIRTKENEPCEYFELKDDVSEEKYYADIYEWLNDQLDIEYVITSRGEYKSGTVVTGTGGPHIEVDTGAREVKGYWGSDRASAYVSSDAIARLDEALEEMYESARG